ncbi:helix-turn-helix domain-containing protein [Streptomyces katsurahamanus]|uniref:Helix-turn-helix transcriptional regulator n=1 Tax=Streptomyces katsurahamanus TaxID=2577098 RepID=A0ABW9NQ54_9ACTN|nr:helix-turn-helix transcriptional regulator [Streptomyces katsurahamanus]MQS35423.1 helix-turn-helix transcriptional regulator [Streptomyces katsurahamanus]
MPQWSEYTDGERIKILRGMETRQSDLAEMTGLSLQTIQQAEQGKRLTLRTLIRIADALGVDTSVVLGQQAPRRSMQRDDRAMVRDLSRTVHDTAAGLLDITDPPALEELREASKACWDTYWRGSYMEAGALARPLLEQAAARLHDQPADEQAEAWGLLADAYRLAAYVANLIGSRDLAYAAIGHAQHAAEQAADDVRRALVMSGRSWVYLRDTRLADALTLAERAATDIEPKFSTATMEQLVAYGSHVNFAAVVASRMEDKERAADYLSQSHATGARMGQEYRAHGTVFGPVSATTQAVGINVALGETGKALSLIGDIKPVHERVLSGAARNRYAMDKALAQADAKLWDASLETLEGALLAAPQWARHQVLPSVIVSRVATGSTTRLRRVVELIGTASSTGGFPPATPRNAL